MNKQNKGITLIALVITIVVLVILVGVSVSVAINTGLIANSKKAVSDYDNAQREEEEQIKTAYDIMESIDSKSLAANVKVGDYVEYTPKKGEAYLSKVGEYETGKTLYEQIGTINQDGVATGKGVQGNGREEQTFTVPTDETELEKLRWRVLSIENGKVNLVSEKTIGKNGLYTGESRDGYLTQGLIGSIYVEKELNSVCSIYGTGDGAESARSLNIEDVNKITGYDVTKDSEFKDVYGTIDGWDNGYRWKNTYYTYSYNKAGLNLKSSDTNSTAYSLIFEPSNKIGSFGGYFLASRSVWFEEDSGVKYACFGQRVVYDYQVYTWEDLWVGSDETADFASALTFPVRPVVTLKSNVKAGELKTGANGERIWTMVIPTQS